MLWAYVLACANSGLGKPPLTTGDTGPVVGAADCPWVGTWNLTAFQCGSFAVDPPWPDYDGANLVVTQNATSGCDVTATIRSTTCTQVEDWDFGPPLGTEVEVTRNGITSCDPASCSLPSGSCAQGGNGYATTTTFIDDSLGDLQAKGLLAEMNEGCPLEIVTTWSPAR